VSSFSSFIVQQGRLPVPVQSAMQLSTLLEESIGTDNHAAQIAAKAAAAATEQACMDNMAAELDR
jgi:hypothetical protein